MSCFPFHWSLIPRSNSQAVSIGLGNGLMLHRRPARETSHYLSQLWPSLPTHIWVWWKCTVSYCWYHNGTTFIISCWRARKVYANYICYILGRSLSCLIFCNYYSCQNWTWRMWSYILSVNTVFNYPPKFHHSRQTSYMENTEQKASWQIICIFENVIKDSMADWVLNKFSSVFYHNLPHSIHSACNY